MQDSADLDSLVLGIDLGTTNCALAVYRGGEMIQVPNALGDHLTPSAVARDPKDGSIIVGRTAREIAASHPEFAALAFKRDMGLEREYLLDGLALTPTELSSFLLKALREDARRHFDQDLTRAVITVPAYFGEPQRQATKRAGELAGLDVVRVLNEPTAAAMAYGLHRRGADGVFLVFDLGGGTFDVSVMELFEESLEVKSTAGESRLGGEDFSQALSVAAAEEAGLDFEVAEFRDPKSLASLRRRTELAKRSISTDETIEIEVPEFPKSETIAKKVSFDAARRQTIWAPLFERLKRPCRTALRGAEIAIEDLDEVVLVGGATRMPAVQALVRELFGSAPRSEVDPDLAISRGAAVQGALYTDDSAVEDLVVTDVLSHSLGVDTSYEIAGRFVDGNFSPVIHRNTTIPTSRTAIYTTLHDNQNVINFGIYEGEARKVEKCRKLGDLSIKVPKRAAGKEAVEIRFTYDLSGMLEVEAKVSSTGKTQSRVFERSQKELSDAERKSAESRLAELKLDPSEDAANRDLLARAEALMMECGPESRQRLEMGILEFEEALTVRTPSLIRTARRNLRELCEQIDGGQRW